MLMLGYGAQDGWFELDQASWWLENSVNSAVDGQQKEMDGVILLMLCPRYSGSVNPSAAMATRYTKLKFLYVGLGAVRWAIQYMDRSLFSIEPAR